MAILDILTCGGTFDKTYGMGAGVRDMTVAQEPAIRGILTRVAPTLDFSIIPLMAKDSLDMTDEDRATVVSACRRLGRKQLIIHGSDTCVLTAETIDRAGLGTVKTIVLTASLLPACCTGSDAEFNAGLAIGVALTAEPGIYIALRGTVFLGRQCRKDPDSGEFVSI